MSDHRLDPALVAETLGTFVLVFAGCGAIAEGTLPPTGIAAAFGLAIIVSIYALGHVSGAHFNPAVTAAFAVGRHFPPAGVVPYWIAQVAGAIVAAVGQAAAIAIGGAVALGSLVGGPISGASMNPARPLRPAS